MAVRNKTELLLESVQIEYGFLIVTRERDRDSVVSEIRRIESNAVPRFDATQSPCRFN